MYTMMIVEDETIIREGLKNCLDWHSLDIEIIGEAADGAAALQLAKAMLPDIVLTDVVMYGMDGIEFVSRLREELSDKQVQVILISGHENWSYIKSALQLQVTDYLLKPFDTAELEQVIHKARKACDAERERRLRDQGLPSQLQAEQDYFLERKAALETAIIVELEQNDRMNRIYSVRLYFDWFRKFERNAVPYLQAFCGILLMQIKQRFTLFAESGSTDFVAEGIEAMKGCTTDEELEEFMINLLDHLAEWIHSKPDQRRTIRSIMELIQSFYMEELTISYIAAQVHLSPNYLATLFKKEVGTTLNDYVTAVRISHAKRLLSEGNLLIQEIAEKVGYKDVKYFTKLFKKEVGHSPRAYREQ